MAGVVSDNDGPSEGARRTRDITRTRIDELLRFLPRFEEAGREFAQWTPLEVSIGVIRPRYPVYARDVCEFMELAGQPWWERGFEHRIDEVDRMLRSDEMIASADMKDVKRMLTFCVREERFCDGFWEGILKSGRVQALLRRLQVIREEMG